jgi:nucleotide-binding universal stress UspA family protein
MSWPQAPLHQIVAAVDGSPTSIRAAEAAMALAGQTDAELVFLYVIDEQSLRQLAALAGSAEDDWRDRMRRSAVPLLDHLVEMARDRSPAAWLRTGRKLVCSGRVEEGDPPRVIGDVARDVGADLVVVGKTGHRGVHKLLVGSVTRRLMESAQIPLLVIPGAEA